VGFLLWRTRQDPRRLKCILVPLFGYIMHMYVSKINDRKRYPWFDIITEVYTTEVYTAVVYTVINVHDIYSDGHMWKWHFQKSVVLKYSITHNKTCLINCIYYLSWATASLKCPHAMQFTSAITHYFKKFNMFDAMLLD
jgi:hypothetical protein